MNTNLKIVLFVLAAVGFFVGFASSIPQIESRPPAETTLGRNLSPEQLAAAGKDIVTGDKGGCLTCHGIGQPGPRAPDLAGVGARAATREPGLTAEQYLRQALLQPCDFVVPGYDCLMGGLALDRNLTPAEHTAVVAFLESLGGEITVSLSPEELAATPAAAPAGGAGLAGTTAEEIIASGGCGGCHALSALGLAAQVGPDLSAIGGRSSPEYIRQSILDPGAVIAANCPGGPCADGVMPKNFGERLTAGQLETLVAFLASQGGATAADATQPATQAAVAAVPTQAAAAVTQAPAAGATAAQPRATANPSLAGGEIAVAVAAVLIPLIIVVFMMMFVGGVGPFASKK